MQLNFNALEIAIKELPYVNEFTESGMSCQALLRGIFLSSINLPNLYTIHTGESFMHAPTRTQSAICDSCQPASQKF